MDGIVYDIWLSLCVTPDSSASYKILSRFPDAFSVYSAEDSLLRELLGRNASDLKRLLDKDLKRAEEIYRFSKEKGVGLLSYYGEDYPERLKGIKTPPVLLYYRGKLPDFENSFALSVVGTRRLSEYGRKNAFSLGRDIALAGGTLVSGMAIGIDGVALAGALSAGGRTVSVIGSGIDVCYPASHKTLAREIVKCGCVFTEFPPGTKPERYNFPKRNRIIAGLSHATVVVEGEEKSGSLITARYAEAEGREVFAFPGRVGDKTSEATNLLIKEGARLITAAEDIISFYEDRDFPRLNPHKISEAPAVNMMEALSNLKVSALVQNEEIFLPRRSSGRKTPDAKDEPESRAGQTRKMPEGELLEVLLKIPEEGDCLIESLADGAYGIREVMRALLRLEMGAYIEILPGERVKRR